MKIAQVRDDVGAPATAAHPVADTPDSVIVMFPDGLYASAGAGTSPL